MKKLKLELDALQVETFRPVAVEPSLAGTVRANSGCCYTGDDCTEYYSTCQNTQNGAQTCQADCRSVNGTCLTGIPINTYEESFCVCSNQYSCDCAFSEASNCHRCTGP
jgi:hypothetical protein